MWMKQWTVGAHTLKEGSPEWRVQRGFSKLKRIVNKSQWHMLVIRLDVFCFSHVFLNIYPCKVFQTVLETINWKFTHRHRLKTIIIYLIWQKFLEKISVVIHMLGKNMLWNKKSLFFSKLLVNSLKYRNPSSAKKFHNNLLNLKTHTQLYIYTHIYLFKSK